MTQRPAGPAVEVLAPAGGPESLTAAVRCGADAVYLGGKSLNARRGAANFDDGGLREAVRYCHVRGVKVYLTINTLVFDRELSQLDEALETACAAGVDAVIVQDLAVAKLVRERAPTLELHASTQMSIHNAAGADLLRRLGFSRVVLARELSRQEIARIRENTDIELEYFVHGALCMSVSGQCYLSSMIGGRSGNRGLCAQPCRLPFSCGGRDHVLSLKDLSLIEQARELGELGIRALKIEGRMKRPEYVAAAVTACRAALAGEPADHAALEAVFSRNGFTSGYLDGSLGPDMFGTRRKEDVQSAAPVLRQLAGLYKSERQSVPVDVTLSLRRGEPAALTAADRDGNAVTVTGPPPQEARTAPTDAAKASVSLAKSGGTPYTICNIESDIDDGLMVPAAQLNALRRDALEELTAIRQQVRPHPYAGGPVPLPPPHRPAHQPVLRARLHRAEQLTDQLAAQVEQIVLPAEQIPRLDEAKLARHAHQLLVEIPEILFDNESKIDEILRNVKQYGVSRCTAGNLGGIAMAQRNGMAVHGDYGLNVTNTLSAGEYAALGLEDLTLSFELELPRIRDLGGDLPRGIIAYGYLPLMTPRNCPAGSCSSCGKDFPEIVDRKGNRFFVDCIWQVPHLYNCVPLVLSDRLAQLPPLDFLTLYFTRESPVQCAEIARKYRAGAPVGGEKTRGLYYRKVQ